VNRNVELLERLVPKHLDEILGEQLRVSGHVEDPFLRIQRRQLPAELGERVDDPRVGLAHPCPEGGAQPDRTGTDHSDVADPIEVLGERGGVGAHRPQILSQR